MKIESKADETGLERSCPAGTETEGLESEESEINLDSDRSEPVKADKSGEPVKADKSGSSESPENYEQSGQSKKSGKSKKTRQSKRSRKADEEAQAVQAIIDEEKAEAIEKITRVLEAKGAELEQAAEELAPEFDYEAEAERLAFEERGEAILKRRGPLPAAVVSASEYPKERKATDGDASWFRRSFLSDRHQLVFGLTLLLAFATAAWQGLDYYIPETVHVTLATLDNVETRDIETRARTVGELKEELIAAGYDIRDIDSLKPTEDKLIENDMELKIMDAYRTSAEIHGHEQEFLLIPGTVKSNLEYNDIGYDEDDEISPELDETVDMDTEISVDEVHYESEEKKEKVEATSKVILDPSLTSGVEKRTEGNDGEGIFTYRYKYVNGKKVKTDRKVKEWITEPHDNELRLGTSATGNKGTYVVTRTFTANCTAYTARAGARGSLGESVHVGTCAVDPSYVSYRSQLWIAGYGYAYANDCGGAVKGNIIDLYMNSTSACIRWGRRNCTAYVLTPAE